MSDTAKKYVSIKEKLILIMFGCLCIFPLILYVLRGSWVFYPVLPFTLLLIGVMLHLYGNRKAIRGFETAASLCVILAGFSVFYRMIAL